MIEPTTDQLLRFLHGLTIRLERVTHHMEDEHGDDETGELYESAAWADAETARVSVANFTFYLAMEPGEPEADKMWLDLDQILFEGVSKEEIDHHLYDDEIGLYSDDDNDTEGNDDDPGS
jgi:hypothetical protein